MRSILRIQKKRFLLLMAFAAFFLISPQHLSALQEDAKDERNSLQILEVLDAAAYEWSDSIDFYCDYSFRRFVTTTEEPDESNLFPGSHVDRLEGSIAKNGNNLICKIKCLSDPAYNVSMQSSSLMSETVGVFEDCGFSYTPFQSTKDGIEFGGQLRVSKRPAGSRYCNGIITHWFPFYQLGGNSENPFSELLQDGARVAVEPEQHGLMKLTLLDSESNLISNFHFKKLDGYPLMCFRSSHSRTISIEEFKKCGETWLPMKLTAVSKKRFKNGDGYMHCIWEGRNLRAPENSDFTIEMSEGVEVKDSANFQLNGDLELDVDKLQYQRKNVFHTGSVNMTNEDIRTGPTKTSGKTLYAGLALFATGVVLFSFLSFGWFRNKAVGIVAVLTVVFSGCADSEKSNLAFNGLTAENSRLSQATSADDHSQGDFLYRFGNRILRFDGNPDSSEISKRFRYKNETSVPLLLHPNGTSCGCTKIFVEKNVLQPGEEQDVLVTISPSTLEQSIYQVAFVEAVPQDDSEPTQSLEFEIIGKIFPSIDFAGVEKIRLQGSGSTQMVVRSFSDKVPADLTFEPPGFLEIESEEFETSEEFEAGIFCRSYLLRFRQTRFARRGEPQYLRVKNSDKETRDINIVCVSPISLSKNQMFFTGHDKSWKQSVIQGAEANQRFRVEYDQELLEAKIVKDDKDLPVLHVRRPEGDVDVFSTEIKILSEQNEEYCVLRVASF